MKIQITTNKIKNFLGLIHNLNSKSASFQEYALKNTLKDYEIPKELKRKIRKIMFLEKDLLKEIKKDERLNEIWEKNKKEWDYFWRKNKKNLSKIKKLFEKELEEYDFNSFKIVEKFFKHKTPKKVTLNLYIGAKGMGGKGNMANFEKAQTFLFPRNFENYSKELVKKDFGILLHEIVHFTQGELYKTENKEFLEKVTSGFAPRGVIYHPDKAKDAEKEMVDILRKEISQNKTYWDLKKEMFE